MTCHSVFPLNGGGGAEDMAMLLSSSGSVTIEDRTAVGRFGLKGNGSAEWLQTMGINVPVVNQHATFHGLKVLRLGANDVVCLEDRPSAELASLRLRWSAACPPKGYTSWREESWAWLRLGGSGLGQLLPRLCPLDLRTGRFGNNEIAQTRFARVDAVLIRSGAGFDVLFDITLTAHVVADIALHRAQSNPGSIA
jgi:sarcosine oxidase subunit gamma